MNFTSAVKAASQNKGTKSAGGGNKKLVQLVQGAAFVTAWQTLGMSAHLIVGGNKLPQDLVQEYQLFPG